MDKMVLFQFFYPKLSSERRTLHPPHLCGPLIFIFWLCPGSWAASAPASGSFTRQPTAACATTTWSTSTSRRRSAWPSWCPWSRPTSSSLPTSTSPHVSLSLQLDRTSCSWPATPRRPHLHLGVSFSLLCLHASPPVNLANVPVIQLVGGRVCVSVPRLFLSGAG